MALRTAGAAAALGLAVVLGGCQTWSTYMPAIEQLGVYKLDINQGNYLT